MVDPMCGSGTLLIEAAMMASDRAPGLHRTHWGFTAWSAFNEVLWRELTSEAQVRARNGLQETTSASLGQISTDELSKWREPMLAVLVYRS